MKGETFDESGPVISACFVFRIVKEFGYVHLSAGDLLRGERAKPGSEVRARLLVLHYGAVCF